MAGEPDVESVALLACDASSCVRLTSGRSLLSLNSVLPYGDIYHENWYGNSQMNSGYLTGPFKMTCGSTEPIKSLPVQQHSRANDPNLSNSSEFAVSSLILII